MEQKQKLYEKLGGDETVEKVVTNFYKRILNDSKINYYYENVDKEALREKFQSYVTMAFGGPSQYSGKSIYNAHKHLNISENDFNIVCQHFVDTLKDMNVDQNDIQSCVDIVMSLKDKVVKQN